MIESGIIICCSFFAVIAIGGWCIYYARHPSEGFRNISWSKKQKKNRFYPGAFALQSYVSKKWDIKLKQEKLVNLEKIHVGKSEASIKKIFFTEVAATVLAVLLVGNGLLLCTEVFLRTKQVLQSEFYLVRQEPGKGTTSVTLKTEYGKSHKNIKITVPERSYSREELEKEWAKGKRYVKRVFLGKNKSSDYITERLRLVKGIPGSEVGVRWLLDQEGVVDKAGTIHNVGWDKPREISITAILIYQKQKQRVPLFLTVQPCKLTREQQFWREWQEQQKKINETTASEKYMKLPQRVNKTKIAYVEKQTRVWPKIAGLLFFLCGAVPFILEENNRQRVKKREQLLKQMYPELVERFILLLSAGMTSKGAWIQMTEQYSSGNRQANYLYEEMLVTRREMENGIGEDTAYESFGRRMSLLCYMKFSTMLVQNRKKGTSDLLKRMEYEAADAFRERRELAKSLGEEAGTKLLFPMMLFLIIVFVMIMYAGFANI